MKLVTYLRNEQELNLISGAEVLLAPKEISRNALTPIEHINSLAQACLDRSLRPILVWDILMTEGNFQKALDSLKKIELKSFYAVRVQDPGALNYLVENFPELKVQMILENGNHNLAAIKNWVFLGGKNLERIILSIELPKDILKNYIFELTKLNINSELMGIGPILLFYSPRSLLNPLLDNKKDEVSAVVSSKESPHKGFKVVENSHGTFMYNTRDHFILDEIESLKEMGLTYLRVETDPSLLNDISALLDNFNQEKVELIKEKYPIKLMKGFFLVNKTDVLFSKLKNYRIARLDENYLGEVVDVHKKKMMGIFLKNPKLDLEIFDSIEIKTPEGKSKTLKVLDLKNSSLEKIEKGSSGSIVFVPHLGGVSVRSAIFKA